MGIIYVICIVYGYINYGVGKRRRMRELDRGE